MQPTFKESKQIDYLEAEKRYETGEFLRDIKRNLGKEEQSPFTIEEELNQSRFDQLQFEKPAFQEQKTTVLPQAKIQSELAQKAPKEIVESIWEMPKEKEHTATKPVIPSVTTREIPKMSVERELGSAVFEPAVKEPKVPKDASRIKTGLDFNGDEQGDFSSIEKRLSSLFNEIEQSMEETHYLQNAVTVFQQEIESYQPITGDEKIVAAGNLIREKLKAIIDKQFVVDEVLDDLISLSKVINKRIDDLDMIEAGLNQRKKRLDQKEILMVETKGRRASEKIEILPEELIMENQDSEYIVAEEDYETIQRYLKRVK
jgi:hypothetical protein